MYITEEIIIYSWGNHNRINFKLLLSNFASIKGDGVYLSLHNAIPYTCQVQITILVTVPSSYPSRIIASDSVHGPILHIDRVRRGLIKFNIR